MDSHRKPTRDEVVEYLHGPRRNWGRWGADDQRGTINLITPDKRIEAARCVVSGQALSLSRSFPTKPSPSNPYPADHFMYRLEMPCGGGAAGDYYGIRYHGAEATHLDALCHVWDDEGMWNGRSPDDELHFDGSSWADVDQWSDGIVTRGVLLDVPGHRGTACVTQETPVHGWELADVATAQGVKITPGDALVVYSGREAWQRQNPEWHPWQEHRPGLHASCLPFLRDTDVSMLCWDLSDHHPISAEYGLSWGVHGAIFAYGLALVDHCLLEPLAAACRQAGRFTFQLTVAPLRVPRGTGSPVNPIAVLLYAQHFETYVPYLEDIRYPVSTR
jgi:kynurenine formamidase